ARPCIRAADRKLRLARELMRDAAMRRHLTGVGERRLSQNGIVPERRQSAGYAVPIGGLEEKLLCHMRRRVGRRLSVKDRRHYKKSDRKERSPYFVVASYPCFSR